MSVDLIGNELTADEDDTVVPVHARADLADGTTETD